MEYRIYAGNKASLENGINYYDFECEPDDVDAAYDILAENIILKNDDDLVDFQNLADDDVEMMLKDAEKQRFISDYEIRK